MDKATTVAASRRRGDALQNRRAILEAAEYLFERNGVDIPLDMIVARSGIARATFFRHFSSRQALFAALLSRTVDDLQDEVAHVRDESARLFRIMDIIVEGLGARPTLTAYWKRADACHPAVRDASARVEKLLAAAIGPAKQAGLCRPDLSSGDLMMLCEMITAAVHVAPACQSAEAARRAAKLALEGYAVRDGTVPDAARSVGKGRQA